MRAPGGGIGYIEHPFGPSHKVPTLRGVHVSLFRDELLGLHKTRTRVTVYICRRSKDADMSLESREHMLCPRRKRHFKFYCSRSTTRNDKDIALHGSPPLTQVKGTRMVHPNFIERSHGLAAQPTRVKLGQPSFPSFLSNGRHPFIAQGKHSCMIL